MIAHLFPGHYTSVARTFLRQEVEAVSETQDESDLVCGSGNVFRYSWVNTHGACAAR